MSYLTNMYRNVNMDSVAARVSLFSVNLHDYRALTSSLFRVVLSYTGELPEDQSELHKQVSSMLKGSGVPVVGSFSALTRQGDIKSLVGFVKASRQILPMDEVKASAKDGRFKAMASNLLMDKTDSSMWEIRSGAAGKYLAKQEHEDLSELVHMATASVHGIPRFATMAHMNVAPREFASLVDANTEEVVHGFVVASTDDKIKIVSFETKEVIEASYDQLIEVNELSEEEAKVPGMEMAAEIGNDEAGMIAYYQKAYGYAPEYVQKIIDIIKMHRFG